MQAQNFMRVEEVAQELGISKSHAYKVIHRLNDELKAKGYPFTCKIFEDMGHGGLIGPPYAYCGSGG